MGKYGRGVATTDEETEERDFEDEEDTIDRRRRSRKNSRRSYATEDEDEDEENGDERRLEVHQSREELDQEDKPAMQVTKPTQLLEGYKSLSVLTRCLIIISYLS